MNITEMVVLVRRDLKDEDSNNYRWTDNELVRHINHTVKEFSGSLPLESFSDLSTAAGSREIDISVLADRIRVEVVEYPLGQFPVRCQRFALWHNTLTLLGEEVPDGSDCRVYYGKLHTLDESASTVPAQHEDLIAAGACGFAAVAWAVYAINQVNTGGTGTPEELLTWGKNMLAYFRIELSRLGHKHRVRISQLYTPYRPVVSKALNYGP